MLLSLHVKNFAIIDEVYVDFGPGMNILSGETGAGKSILLGSVSAALGGRVNREMLGRKADYALAELVFDGENETVRELLKRQELPIEENLIISRRISDNGRSISRVNGEAVSTAFLKELADCLLEVYGQHEYQTLLSEKNQLHLLDRFDRGRSEPLLSNIAEEYAEYRRAEKEYEEALGHAEGRTRELSLLQYEHDEIEKAALKPGEDAALEERYRVLANQSRILEAVSEADRVLHTDSDCASDKLGRALRLLSRVTEYDSKLSDISADLEQIEEQLTDIGCRLSDYREEAEGDPEELNYTEERLNLINRLKSKYGKTLEDIAAYDAGLMDRIEKLTDFDRYLENLQRTVKSKEKSLKALCEKLTDIRLSAAKELTASITEALKELNFPSAVFRIDLSEAPLSADGCDAVTFMISANPGEPVRPLSKVASGGELSRISLAVKSVFAGRDEIETLILDEIDSGISGRTAQKVAEKMAAISGEHQILCITHLPQIAAMADRHFLIDKTTDGQSTMTVVKPLSEEETVDELARMLGGAEITDSVRQNAKEMRMLAKKNS